MLVGWAASTNIPFPVSEPRTSYRQWKAVAIVCPDKSVYIIDWRGIYAIDV